MITELGGEQITSDITLYAKWSEIDKGISGGAVAAIIIGSIALVGGASAGVFLFLRKRKIA